MSEENNSGESQKEEIAQNINSSKKIVFAVSQAAEEALEKAGYAKEDPHSPLMYAIRQATGQSKKGKAPALAFTESPIPNESYHGLYKHKRKLLPDDLLKQIRVTDHLVAAILRARGSQLSAFGRLPKDRFDIGIEVKIKPEFYKILTPEQHFKIVERIKRFEQIILNCGHTDGLEQQDRMTLADYLDIQTRNGLTFGRFATEIIYDRDVESDQDGRFPFARFRPVDVATIHRAVRKGDQEGDKIREQAIGLLQKLSGEKIDINYEKLKEDEYAWVQVIQDQPRQAFTHEEMLVYNLFPSTDIEHNGYPVSPLDTVVSSVTTHISIDSYKKLYFQNGRATKGILVIKSDEVDESILNGIKMQFNASVNNVSNSFRTPIFGMGKDDDINWVPMVGEGARDADFQFMYDQVARNILSTFGISPDELPGYAHLSRGTNAQTLSESSNEYKLTASRDASLRPLILKWQTFFNLRLFPIIDPLLSKICEIRFIGIDAQSKEQEATRLQQDMPTHMTYDEVLAEVGKDSVGSAFGGNFPFNERYQVIADKFLNISELKAHFLNDPGATVDPVLKYKRDPYFLQYLQLMMQTNPSAIAAYFAPKPPELSLELLKMEIQDQLDEE